MYADAQNEESESEVAQLCLTLCDPMDCSLAGSSVHGVLQARVPEWVARKGCINIETSMTLSLPLERLGFQGGASGKNLPAHAGDVEDAGLILGWGRSPGGGPGSPLQCSCLENPKAVEPDGLQFIVLQRIRQISKNEADMNEATQHTERYQYWTPVSFSLHSEESCFNWKIQIRVCT